MSMVRKLKKNRKKKGGGNLNDIRKKGIGGCRERGQN
jgi:hypothetical protein